jgi:uncharacterized protein
MTPVFVDTSGLYALLVATDTFHRRAREAFSGLRREDARLVTTSYVLVETYPLIQRRVGVTAVQALRRGFAPLLDVVWIDSATHESALDEVDRLGDLAVSLVDAASFVVMRERSIHRAFAFDQPFEESGFELVG